MGVDLLTYTERVVQTKTELGNGGGKNLGRLGEHQWNWVFLSKAEVTEEQEELMFLPHTNECCKSG